MPERPQILCFGRDQALLDSRRLLLQTRFVTEVTTRFGTLSAQITRPGCDLVILCHSVEPEEAEKVCKLIARTSPATKVLAVVIATRSIHFPRCAEELWVHDGPGALLAKACKLLGVSNSDERLASDCLSQMENRLDADAFHIRPLPGSIARRGIVAS
jgi:hypothetical protein